MIKAGGRKNIGYCMNVLQKIRSPLQELLWRDLRMIYVTVFLLYTSTWDYRVIISSFSRRILQKTARTGNILLLYSREDVGFGAAAAAAAAPLGNCISRIIQTISGCCCPRLVSCVASIDIPSIFSGVHGTPRLSLRTLLSYIPGGREPEPAASVCSLHCCCSRPPAAA
ncbi:unnamed protein product [Trichogramma brassicae]|uniref:Uncharacterized protein n=1 Tax=Trichogramma brassicae TaxID=86971 RepID=A0A6H5IDT2_9HYME|nr:unnamed protein product [Trichogramma brassicae]